MVHTTTRITNQGASSACKVAHSHHQILELQLIDSKPIHPHFSDTSIGKFLFPDSPNSNILRFLITAAIGKETLLI